MKKVVWIALVVASACKQKQSMEEYKKAHPEQFAASAAIESPEVQEQIAVARKAADDARKAAFVAQLRGSKVSRKVADKLAECVTKGAITESEAIDAAKSRTPAIGMKSATVEALWGRPNDINRTVVRNGVHEQWVYSSGVKSAYIYFDNGILTGFQE